MLSVVIKGPTIEEARAQLTKAMELSDIAELRLDLFSSRDLSSLRTLRAACPMPIIMTLRRTVHGGMYPGSLEEWVDELNRLMPLAPEYVDVDLDCPPAAVAELSRTAKIILSYHNFDTTPDDPVLIPENSYHPDASKLRDSIDRKLGQYSNISQFAIVESRELSRGRSDTNFRELALDSLLEAMSKTPASVYKISVMAHTATEALRLLCWSKDKPNLTAMSMGPHGHASRILGRILDFPITYASLEEGQETALGQLPISTLLDRYHIRTLSPRSSIYGLIGDPVDKSVSDLSHNPLCEQLGLDAVYIKMQVKPEELEQFLSYAKQLPYQGLSVTRPLKEAILPFLDEVEPPAREIGAVNTVCFREGKAIGSNTDSIGALNALERVLIPENSHHPDASKPRDSIDRKLGQYSNISQFAIVESRELSRGRGDTNFRELALVCPVLHKRVLILGAGGAAKAIAYEALRRGARVTLVGRNPDRVKTAAEWLGCDGITLDRMDEAVSKGYEIIINATPDFMPIAKEQIIPKCVAMDIHTRPKMTVFLQEASARGCTLVYGYWMFIEQAVLQWGAWRPGVSPEACQRILEKSVSTSLHLPTQ